MIDNTRKVYGKNVNTTWEEFRDDIHSNSIIGIEVGTTGYGSSRGSKTYFRLDDLWHSKMEIYEVEKNHSNVTIKLDGDSELENFLEALKFAVNILEKQIKKKSKIKTAKK